MYISRRTGVQEMLELKIYDFESYRQFTYF